jgi:hypothetical protein
VFHGESSALCDWPFYLETPISSLPPLFESNTQASNALFLPDASHQYSELLATASQPGAGTNNQDVRHSRPRKDHPGRALGSWQPFGVHMTDSNRGQKRHRRYLLPVRRVLHFQNQPGYCCCGRVRQISTATCCRSAVQTRQPG